MDYVCFIKKDDIILLIFLILQKPSLYYYLNLFSQLELIILLHIFLVYLWLLKQTNDFNFNLYVIINQRTQSPIEYFDINYQKYAF